jgi:hypothetical protein
MAQNKAVSKLASTVPAPTFISGIDAVITPTNPVYQGQEVKISVSPPPPSVATPGSYNWTITPQGPTSYVYHSGVTQADPTIPGIFIWDTTNVEPGSYSLSLTVTDSTATLLTSPIYKLDPSQVTVRLRPLSSGDPLQVTLLRSQEQATSDEALWVAIRNSCNQLSFQNYVDFVDNIMCCPGNLDASNPASGNANNPCALPPLGKRRFLPFPNMDAYRVLKVATECFVMMNCGVYLPYAKLQALLSNSDLTNPYDITDDASRLNLGTSGLPDTILKWWTSYLASSNPYLSADPNLQGTIIPYLALVRSRLSELGTVDDCKMGVHCYGILKRKLTNPCFMELIWSYWQEEGMLVQTLNAVSRRFQNLRGAADHDPLTRFDIDPLRQLNSLLWGYVQDEQHRLSVVRRAYEYNHEYGLALEGKALRALRPSDSRSKFLEAFHNLLYLCTIFFKEDDDTTVVADGFPVLNALKEVHYILAAGAANQFGELPSTARQEMLMQQWLLARPEMREFLGGKIMVPYPEEWMDRVDTVKTMQGWTDVSVIYFRDLAVYGEQIVLSVRYGAWSITNNPAQAANWARYWRPEIQAYIHAYRAATGVDLTSEPVNSTLPSVLLLRRLATQRPALRG